MIGRAIEAYNNLTPFNELSGIEKAFRVAGFLLCGVAVAGVAALTYGTGAFALAKLGVTSTSVFTFGAKTALIPEALMKVGAAATAVGGLLGFGALRASNKKPNDFSLG